MEEVRKTRDMKDGDPPPKFASMILPATELERISLMPRSKTQVDRDRRATLRREVNTELNFRPNFEGLVLGCIDADFLK